MPLPPDYPTRVYAGVLGKIIGVYLGRPFEGWSREHILRDLGEIWYYVHDRLNKPLVVTDDDISGTFTFLRSLTDYFEDHAGQADARTLLKTFEPKHIGHSWLNYIIENRAVLWWGGMAQSTEHTAFLRLKNRIDAPASGSIETNGAAVAEQIGAQIFIDGWGMIAPGDPELAADLAQRAGSVSHDGESVYAAQVVAAIEAVAFVERDLAKLLDTAAGLIPRDSIIYRMIADLRHAHAGQRTPDWNKAFTDVMQGHYGYDRFPGNCHVVPNHGVIILALLWGDDDFQKSLMIANTCGWDTDCNSGNVGCILGIKNGLSAIDTGPDWRTPVADRIYLPTADGGRFCSDAVQETRQIVRLGRMISSPSTGTPGEGRGGGLVQQLRQNPLPASPGVPGEEMDSSPRYDFSFPGSVQGWFADPGIATVSNAGAGGGLAIDFAHLAPGRAARAMVETFPAPAFFNRPNYAAMACPAVYSGQTITARLSLQRGQNVQARLIVRHYGAGDALIDATGPSITLNKDAQTLQWQIPSVSGPIGEIGVEITGPSGAAGRAILHSFDWTGAPNVTFARPEGARAAAWKNCWSNGIDQAVFRDAGPSYHLMQNRGRGLLIQGSRQWTDYRAEARITPHLANAAGLAVRVQGMERYYAILLRPGGKAQLVKCNHTQTVLAEAAVDWQREQSYLLVLQITGNNVQAFLDGKTLAEATDAAAPLRGGAVALVVEEGALSVDYVKVSAS